MESHLKDRVIKHLQDDFFLEEEAVGINLIENRHVRIDFLAYPKPKLVERGFLSAWFGIEVKHIATFGRPGSRGKKSKLLWQAMTYSQSVFELESSPDNILKFRPEFTLVYAGQDDPDTFDDPEWHCLLNLAWYGRTGWLRLLPKSGWAILFAGGAYFSKKKGEGNVNVSGIRHTGTI